MQSAISKAALLLKLPLQSNIKYVCTFHSITLMIFWIFFTAFKSSSVCFLIPFVSKGLLPATPVWFRSFCVCLFLTREQFPGLWVPGCVRGKSLPWLFRAALFLASTSARSLSGPPGAPAYLITARTQREREVWIRWTSFGYLLDNNCQNDNPSLSVVMMLLLPRSALLMPR